MAINEMYIVIYMYCLKPWLKSSVRTQSEIVYLEVYNVLQLILLFSKRGYPMMHAPDESAEVQDKRTQLH